VNRSAIRVPYLCMLVACGGRSELDDADVHVALDASHDAVDDDVVTFDDAPSTCGETLNAQTPAPGACNQGITWIAWAYIPTHSLTAGAIELFTNDGKVALLDSTGSEPGATLATGTLAPQGPPTTWKTATLSQHVALVAGHRYFIAENVERCSVATTGTPYPYFGSDSLAGPWTGPFQSWAFTSRIDCVP
jgi:hypothetical protein